MKKLRIEIKDDRYKRYELFNSIEALYIWLSEGTSLDEFMASNEDCVTEIELDEDGQFIEVEWMGCEFVRGECIHYVRAARATPKPDSNDYSLSIYVGWIHRNKLSFCNVEDSEVIQRRIDNEGQIDIDSIFSQEK